jgi:hypothetical protein
MARGTMSNRARLFIVPLVVLSVVLVALVVAIVVVVVVRGRGPADEVDACVVGTWRVAAHREEVTTARFGAVTFTGTGPGATVRLGDDGAGVTDYGTVTRFKGATAGAHTIGLEVTGTVTYRYEAAGGTVSFRDPTSHATAAIFVDAAKSTEIRFTGSTDPADYKCSGDRLTFKTKLYETTLTRIRQ